MKLYPYHTMYYNFIYAKKEVYVQSLRKRVLRLRKSARREGVHLLLLLKEVQVRMEQNIRWLLEREENAEVCERENVEESRRCKREKQSKLERWEENRQGWLRFVVETQAQIFGLSRLRERAQVCDGATSWKSLRTSGGGTPC